MKGRGMKHVALKSNTTVVRFLKLPEFKSEGQESTVARYIATEFDAQEFSDLT